MIVVTTENIPGFRVRQVLGPVFGLTVRSRGIGGNFAAGLRSITGGEVTAYVRLLEDARRQALDRLVQTATAMGANAITMMRYDSSEIGQTMSEIVAYGTAVVVDTADGGWAQQPVAAGQPAAAPAIGPEAGQQPWGQQPAPQAWEQQPGAQPPYPPQPPAAPHQGWGEQQPGVAAPPPPPPPPPPAAWGQQPGQPEPYPPYPPQQS